MKSVENISPEDKKALEAYVSSSDVVQHLSAIAEGISHRMTGDTASQSMNVMGEDKQRASGRRIRTFDVGCCFLFF